MTATMIMNRCGYINYSHGLSRLATIISTERMAGTDIIWDNGFGLKKRDSYGERKQLMIALMIGTLEFGAQGCVKTNKRNTSGGCSVLFLRYSFPARWRSPDFMKTYGSSQPRPPPPLSSYLISTPLLCILTYLISSHLIFLSSTFLISFPSLPCQLKQLAPLSRQCPGLDFTIWPLKCRT